MAQTPAWKGRQIRRTGRSSCVPHPILTCFWVGVAMAGAIVMYDRTRTLARFADRPIREGGPGATAIPDVKR